MPQRARQALALTKALVRGGHRRQTAVAEILRPANLFQPHATTSADRYPVEFAAAADALTTAAPSILSFGCSSGEELLSLRGQFPDARIHGVDINPVAVRRARRAVADDPAITVARAGDAEGLEQASYDVVTALAVFRHADLNEAPPRCDPTLRFADFERTVDRLARCVRPGGVLVIRHANFRFTDCAVAADFEAVRTGFASAGEGGLLTPIYGRDDALIGTTDRDDGIYRRTR
ncbi:class I SAM-dependent methyltransferase [Nocardioides marmoriginsengisoli]|nr:class I SAM-dependent methyltransferase [Nocardioides marmoriginsengisoli]